MAPKIPPIRIAPGNPIIMPLEQSGGIFHPVAQVPAPAVIPRPQAVGISCAFVQTCTSYLEIATSLRSSQ